ncbi:hypothetical protein JCM10207_005631 [Rhodosporidiobolus poonsookiae]
MAHPHSHSQQQHTGERGAVWQGAGGEEEWGPWFVAGGEGGGAAIGGTGGATRDLRTGRGALNPGASEFRSTAPSASSGMVRAASDSGHGPTGADEDWGTKLPPLALRGTVYPLVQSSLQSAQAEADSLLRPGAVSDLEEDASIRTPSPVAVFATDYLRQPSHSPEASPTLSPAAQQARARLQLAASSSASLRTNGSTGSSPIPGLNPTASVFSSASIPSSPVASRSRLPSLASTSSSPVLDPHRYGALPFETLDAPFVPPLGGFSYDGSTYGPSSDDIERLSAFFSPHESGSPMFLSVAPTEVGSTHGAHDPAIVGGNLMATLTREEKKRIMEAATGSKASKAVPIKKPPPPPPASTAAAPAMPTFAFATSPEVASFQPRPAVGADAPTPPSMYGTPAAASPWAASPRAASPALQPPTGPTTSSVHSPAPAALALPTSLRVPSRPASVASKASSRATTARSTVAKSVVPLVPYGDSDSEEESDEKKEEEKEGKEVEEEHPEDEGKAGELEVGGAASEKETQGVIEPAAEGVLASPSPRPLSAQPSSNIPLTDDSPDSTTPSYDPSISTAELLSDPEANGGGNGAGTARPASPTSAQEGVSRPRSAAVTVQGVQGVSEQGGRATPAGYEVVEPHEADGRVEKVKTPTASAGFSTFLHTTFAAPIASSERSTSTVSVSSGSSGPPSPSSPLTTARQPIYGPPPPAHLAHAFSPLPSVAHDARFSPSLSPALSVPAIRAGAAPFFPVLGAFNPPSFSPTAGLPFPTPSPFPPFHGLTPAPPSAGGFEALQAMLEKAYGELGVLRRKIEKYERLRAQDGKRIEEQAQALSVAQDQVRHAGEEAKRAVERAEKGVEALRAVQAQVLDFKGAKARLDRAERDLALSREARVHEKTAADERVADAAAAGRRRLKEALDEAKVQAGEEREKLAARMEVVRADAEGRVRAAEERARVVELQGRGSAEVQRRLEVVEGKLKEVEGEKETLATALAAEKQLRVDETSRLAILQRDLEKAVEKLEQDEDQQRKKLENARQELEKAQTEAASAELVRRAALNEIGWLDNQLADAHERFTQLAADFAAVQDDIETTLGYRDEWREGWARRLADAEHVAEAKTREFVELKTKATALLKAQTKKVAVLEAEAKSVSSLTDKLYAAETLSAGLQRELEAAKQARRAAERGFEEAGTSEAEVRKELEGVKGLLKNKTEHDKKLEAEKMELKEKLDAKTADHDNIKNEAAKTIDDLIAASEMDRDALTAARTRIADLEKEVEEVKSRRGTSLFTSRSTSSRASDPFGRG